MDAIDWLQSLPEGSADVLCTDPPYGSGGLKTADRVKSSANVKYLGKNCKFPEFEGENKDQWSYFQWSQNWMRQAYKALKPDGKVMIFIDWRQLAIMHTAFQMAGFALHGIVVWDKTQAARPQKGKFRQQSEFILWGGKGPWRSKHGNVLPGVITCSPQKGGKHHSVGKPLEVMKRLIEVTDLDDLIIDPFAGSATTGVAAIEMGRRFSGCEAVTEYVEVAGKRLENALQSKAT